MPIRKAEFERGEKDEQVGIMIKDFLRKNNDRAFTAMEIAEGLGYNLGFETLIDFIVWMGLYSIINKLVERNIISHKKIDFQDYYMTK